MTLPLNPLPLPDRERFVVCLAPPELNRAGPSQMLIQIANMDGFPPYAHQQRLTEDGALAYLRLLLGSLVPASSACIAEALSHRIRW